MIRKLLPLVAVVSLALPTLASARVVDGIEPVSPRSIEESASRSYRAPADSETEEVDGDIDFSDLKESMDGYGGGGMYMPPYYGGGISVDVSTTKTVTPDTLSISGWCDAGVSGSRANVRDALKKQFDDIKAKVGADGKVRRSGGYSITPYYDPMTGMTKSDTFMGNLNLWVDVINFSASDRIAEVLEDAGCSVSWNVAVEDPQEIEYSVLDNLISRLNRRKEVFEKLLKTKLNDDQIVGASLSSWIDSWSSYDPESNTATATVTLSVIFSNDTSAR
ncbi:MAG: SIMPL domain-containing protein [Candidatus Peribacteraceae bacterium]|nr:SIMPL domain-containing protein [Candidatus Peribacteraceae bacterium]